MSKVVRFKIDEKSLFRGVRNDYDRGQTATVSTPINQNKDPKKWRHDILALCDTNSKIDIIPSILRDKCEANSKAGCEITDLFVFDNISLDGVKLKTTFSFGMYIKKETDELKKHNGVLQKNLHFGRLKLHYPISLKHLNDGFNINNEEVLNSILEQNGGFAFVVRGFEYNEETKALNFITSLLGPKGISLTTVFKRAKGVGKKLMVDPNKVVDNNYIVVVDIAPETREPITTYELINKSRVENGKAGEEYVYKILAEKLTEDAQLYHTSLDYPQSPYDIEYLDNGIKKYVEVKATSGTKAIFNLSVGEREFMEKYKENYVLYMVTKVNDPFPEVKIYTYSDIKRMKKSYPTITYYA